MTTERLKKAWERFEFKAAILYAGYGKERWTELKRKTDAAGMGEVVPFWNVRNPFEGLVLERMPANRMITGSAGMLNSLMGHYRAIKTALALGAQSVLVLEDDVELLKDQEKLAEIVESLPNDFDLALLDWWPRGKATEAEYAELRRDAARVREAGHWTGFSNLRSAACYAMSRKAMEQIAYEIECRSIKLKVTDQYWPSLAECFGMSCICASPHAAIQGKRGRSLSSMDVIWGRYERLGVKPEDYV